MKDKKYLLQRVTGYVLGFLLFYEPFMLFGKITGNFFTEQAFTSIHVPCARIPLANILTGELSYSGPTSLFFCLLLAVISLWFGPLFCGRLCPAGGFAEFLSSLLPDKFKIDWSRFVPIIPLRSRVFPGFLASVLLGCVVPGADCNYFALEIFANFLFSVYLICNLTSLLATFVLAYIILGCFTKGGRGYCNFLCPVGMYCSVFHKLGQYLPGPFRMQVQKNICVGCGKCQKICPMRAITVKDRKAEINIMHCIVCGQCSRNCPVHAIIYASNMKKEVSGK